MGLDLGLEEAGWPASLAVEMEPVFCDTIRTNRPGIDVLQTDVADLTAKDLFERSGADQVDLMVGGPPCQSFSSAGKRAGLNDPRGNAIYEYLRLISEVRPRAFVLENVANLVTAAIKHRPIAQRPGKSWNLASYTNRRSKEQDTLFAVDATPEHPPLSEDELSGSAMRMLLATVIKDLGYHVRFSILDAADYGAPQRRLRFVMIGTLEEPPPTFIRPTHGIDSQPFKTVRDAIGDLEANPGPGAAYGEKTKEYFDLVPEGGNWRDLPYEVAKEAMGEKSLQAGGGKTGFFRRLSWEGQSPTVTGKPNRKGSAMCHPSASRPLSVRECARLQGFPDDWEIVGSVGHQYLQIGNAVPVSLGRAIGETLHRPAPDSGRLDHEAMLEEAVKTLRASARNKRSRTLVG